MRFFFALELAPETALQVAHWRDGQFHSDGTAVPPANFHITLAFIGELREPALERLCLAVDQWLARAKPGGGILTLDRTGFWSRPGIHWLGPQSWPEQADILARRLRSLANAAGARRDRNTFRPHVTLYRRCSNPPPAPTAAPNFTVEFGHFSLFESRQGKSGVSYHPVQDWDLV